MFYYFSEVCGIARMQPTIEVPQWIPCSERLPEFNNKVLITLINKAGKHVTESIYKDDKFYYTAETDNGYYEEVFSAVIAWMPLPQAYTGKESD